MAREIIPLADSSERKQILLVYRSMAQFVQDALARATRWDSTGEVSTCAEPVRESTCAEPLCAESTQETSLPVHRERAILTTPMTLRPKFKWH